MYHCVSDYIWFASSYELWKLTNGAGNPSSVHASKSPGPRSSNDEVTTARRRTYAPEIFFPIFRPVIIHRIKVPLSLSNHTCYLYRNECSLKIFHFNDLTPFVAKFRITTISRKWPFQFHISRIFDTIITLSFTPKGTVQRFHPLSRSLNVSPVLFFVCLVSFSREKETALRRTPTCHVLVSTARFS